MVDNARFVLMIQPMSRQGAIWQAILRGAVARTRRMLELLDRSTLDSGALINALLGASQDKCKGTSQKDCQKVSDL